MIYLYDKSVYRDTDRFIPGYAKGLRLRLDLDKMTVDDLILSYYYGVHNEIIQINEPQVRENIHSVMRKKINQMKQMNQINQMKLQRKPRKLQLKPPLGKPPLGKPPLGKKIKSRQYYIPVNKFIYRPVIGLFNNLISNELI